MYFIIILLPVDGQDRDKRYIYDEEKQNLMEKESKVENEQTGKSW